MESPLIDETLEEQQIRLLQEELNIKTRLLREFEQKYIDYYTLDEVASLLFNKEVKEIKLWRNIPRRFYDMVLLSIIDLCGKNLSKVARLHISAQEVLRCDRERKAKYKS